MAHGVVCTYFYVLYVPLIVQCSNILYVEYDMRYLYTVQYKTNASGLVIFFKQINTYLQDDASDLFIFLKHINI